MPETYVDRIKALCMEANEVIGLSTSVFKFPLHISLKKSFYTDSFPEVKNAVLEYFRSLGPFHVKVGELVKHDGMLWLDIVPTEALLKVHEDLDALLESRFQIPRHRFDKHFSPHISLFTDRDADKIEDMFEALREEFCPEVLPIRKIVVGAERERDTYLEL